MNATVRITSASTDSVQIPTMPIKITPGLAIEIDAILWAERLFAVAKPASKDAERFAAGL